MTIERSNRPVAAARIATIARGLLDASTLCSIATVSPGGRAHANTAYFAWSPRFDIVWLSDPGARHSRNARATRSVAIAVYDSNQTWGRPDRGIQLFGSAGETSGRSAADSERVYLGRFPGYSRAEFGSYRFYRLRPRRLKIFDERALGSGVFVTARVGPGGEVAWERTEILRGSGR